MSEKKIVIKLSENMFQSSFEWYCCYSLFQNMFNVCSKGTLFTNQSKSEKIFTNSQKDLTKTKKKQMNTIENEMNSYVFHQYNK